jgi:PAS domain S-box-containing protein
MRKRQFGLRARLIAIVMLAVVPAALLIARNASVEHEALLQAQRDDNTRLVRLVSMQQARLFEGSQHLLLALSRTDAVRRDDPASCGRYLADLVSRYSWYSLFGVATPDGRVVCHSREALPNIGIADRPYFQRALHTRDFAVGEHQIGRSTGQSSFSVAYPVLSDSGQVLAVLFASVRMDQFERLGTEIGLPAHAVLITADRNGTVLSRYPDAQGLIGTRLPAGALLDAASSGSSGTVEGAGIDRVERIYSYTTLSGPEGPRVFTAVGMPREEILAAARRELWLNLATVGALLLLSFAAAWFGGNTFLLRHLRHLAASARALSEGRLHARTGIRDAPGELGEVVRAFDHMARALEERDAARALIAAIVDSSTDAIVGKDLSSIITSWNPGAQSLFGYTAADIVGRSVMVLIPADRRQEEAYVIERVKRGECVPNFETVRIRKDGRAIDVSVTISPIIDPSGAVIGASKVARDVSERRQARQALELANARLHALSTRLLQTQEAERQSVAYELRDEICQALAAIQMNVQAAKNRAPLPQLDASLQIADATLQRVRAFSESLRPPQIVELGLEAAVRSYLERRSAATGLAIAFKADAAGARLPADLELTCFRIIQEALENAIRHACATHAWVELATHSGELHVTVSDDGGGFEVEAATRGTGLAAMTERVMLAGGRLEIASSKALGTEVQASLPLVDSPPGAVA